MSLAAQKPHGPPYAPQTAGIGGEPEIIPDVPITAVFLFLYVLGAATSMTIFQLNRRKGHKFVMQAMLFSFCMARILTCTLRIVWATRHSNISLAIAAQIFVNAGILIVYIINLIFAQRIVRAMQPQLGWHRLTHWAFVVLYALTAVALCLVISLTVESFYTLNETTRADARDVELAATTYLLLVAAMPLPLLALPFLLLPKSQDAEHFGKGGVKSKAIILLVSTCFSITIAGFRAGTLWEEPRPRNDPAWYDSKAAFYIFNFTMEICILITFLVGRVDQRFHVPDRSSKRRSYRENEFGSVAHLAEEPAKMEEVFIRVGWT